MCGAWQQPNPSERQDTGLYCSWPEASHCQPALGVPPFFFFPPYAHVGSCFNHCFPSTSQGYSWLPPLLAITAPAPMSISDVTWELIFRQQQKQKKKPTNVLPQGWETDDVLRQWLGGLDLYARHNAPAAPDQGLRSMLGTSPPSPTPPPPSPSFISGYNKRVSLEHLLPDVHARPPLDSSKTRRISTGPATTAGHRAEHVICPHFRGCVWQSGVLSQYLDPHLSLDGFFFLVKSR